MLQVLYLIFNEGYTASSGEELQRVELTAEAIRLTRMLRSALPDDGEVAGLLALMLLTDSRRTARSTADGGLVPIDEQDRTLWDRAQISEGAELIWHAAPGRRRPVSDPGGDRGDPCRGAECRGDRLAADPLAVRAAGEARAEPDGHAQPRDRARSGRGSAGGLELLATLDDDKNITETHRLDAVRAHLYERAGESRGARALPCARPAVRRACPSSAT